jgi:Tol biopolymer transport system component
MKTSTIPTVLLALVTALLLAGSAHAKVPGSNGRIVFDNDDGPMYTVEPDGSDLRQVTEGHDQAHYSSDGSRIAMDAGLDEQHVTTALMDADGSNLTIQPIPDPTGSIVCPIWEPGDAHLACEFWDETQPDRPAGLFTIHVSGWDFPTRLTTNPYGGHDIPGDYSPDGKWLAFWREDPARGGAALFVLDLATGAEDRISDWLADTHTVSWSPDGRKLISDDSRGNLQVSRPDGTRHRQITLQVPGRRYAWEPTWSPDGKRIAFSLFTGRAGAGRLGIYTARPDGSDVRAVALATEGAFSNADWGPARSAR